MINGRLLADDPHECHQCRRRYPKPLGRYPSGIYSCGQSDCFSVYLKDQYERMKSTKAGRAWLKFEKQMREYMK